MDQHEKNHEMVDDEINVWELVGRVQAGWRWLAVGGAAGLAAAFLYIFVTPTQYEASAVIQPAVFGVISGTTTTTTTASVMVEPLGQTLERTKLVTFYADDIINHCQSTSPRKLAKDVKTNIVKGTNLLSITYRAESVTVAKTCIRKIVGQLTKTLSVIATPLIAELEEQRTSTKQQIGEAERFLARSSAPSVPFAGSGESVLVMLKRDELWNLQKLYREQRIQLTEPLTQPMKLLGPIYGSDNAVHPNKPVAAGSGLLGGAFAGLVALLLYGSWRNSKSLRTRA